MAPPTPRGPRPRSGVAALLVLCAAQFVLILDIAVVNVALVPLARDLGMTSSLQLIASVYAATFGGALLVGGRIADRGRRRLTFLVGLVLFAAASALCGAAWAPPVVIVGRAAQGLGAALASPAALSLITTTFSGPERDRALGAWASVAAAGGAAGLILGGLLTASLGWRSVFFVNLPVVVVIVVAALRVLPADRVDGALPELPWGSGVAAAAAVVLLVAGMSAVGAGRGLSVTAIVLLLAAAGAFVAQRRFDRGASDPLVPRELLRSRSVVAANAMTALMSAVVLGVNVFLAIFLQGQLGLGAVATGLAFLPITVVSAGSAWLSARFVAATGPRLLLSAGMALTAVGCLLLGRIMADASYVTAVLPGMVLVAAGMGPGFAVGSIAATDGVRPVQQGAAAALLSTSTQAGAAVGVALLGVLAASVDVGDPVAGLRAAFDAMAVFAVGSLVAALATPRHRATVPASPPGASAPPLGGAGPGAGDVRVLPALPAQAAGCWPGCAEALTGAPRPPSTSLPVPEV